MCMCVYVLYLYHDVNHCMGHHLAMGGQSSASVASCDLRGSSCQLRCALPSPVVSCSHSKHDGCTCGT